MLKRVPNILLLPIFELMSLRKKHIGPLVGFIILALAGLIVIQVLHLQSNFRLQDKTFDNTIFGILTTVIEKLETQRALSIIVQTAQEISWADSTMGEVLTNDSFRHDSTHVKIMVVVSDSADAPQSITKILPDSLQRIGEFKTFSDTETYMTISLEGINDTFFREHHIDDTGVVKYMITTAQKDSQVNLIERVLNRMWESEIIPLEAQIDSAMIDSIIAANLDDAEIDIDYIFGINPGDSDSLYFASEDSWPDLENSKYRKKLFPYDLPSPSSELMLYFPNKKSFLWKQILPVLLTTLLFIFIIIFSFVYTIKAIAQQKQNIHLLTDFVNNMTHEFKTPISTISLAAEALQNKSVLNDSDKSLKYSSMILEENSRMRRQAEKILQMAALEKGDIRLKSEPIDLHQLILEATAGVSLFARQKGGAINTTLDAEQYFLNGDRVHLSGIIYNLLDNACKYSNEKPAVEVITSNKDNGITITIIDNGIGIKENELGLVFDKYYRISSGNIHDVKGFGLGLSYVKLMVKRHGGTITLNSVYGQGTTVEIFFPGVVQETG